MASAACATCARSDSGMPTMSDSVRIGSSLEQCSTKSAPLPASRSSATMSRAFALIESSMRRTWRGVNAACTTLRIMVCRGGSIARKDCDASSNSSGTFSNSTPLPDRNDVAVAADGDDVGMPGHRPVAGIGRVVHQRVLDRRVPADGPLGAQRGERLLPLGGAGGPERPRGQVDGVMGMQGADGLDGHRGDSPSRGRARR